MGSPSSEHLTPPLRLVTGAGTASLVPGTKLGPYVVAELLGVGGMGEVYRAFDPRLGRHVAIKMLRDDLADDVELRLRFERETHILSTLAHKNICTVFDTGTHAGQTFIVMELLEGRTLEEELRAGPMPLSHLLDVAVQVTDALRSAHERGLVHRDIKSANIFLTSHDDAKVLDFGIAKSQVDAAPESASNGATREGIVLGTVGFMSPEQVRGEPLDARSDLFSFGLVLYHMATGAVPFMGGAISVLARIATPVPAPRLRDQNPALPDELDAIVARALEKDRKDRYASASEMLTDLRRLRSDVASGRIEATAAITPVAKARRWVRRHRRTQLAALAIAAVIPIATLLPRGTFAPAPELISVAVMPLVSRGGLPADAYLADGLYSALIGELVRSPTLQVLPRSSVTSFGAGPDGSNLAFSSLPAEAVVTAELFHVGDSLGLHVELRRGNPPAVLWTGRFYRKRGDLQSLPAELAAAIARELRAQVDSRGARRLQAARVLDPAAYDAWMRAAYHASRRRRDDLKACVTNAARATALAPEFADAYLLAAHCNNLLASVDTVAPDSAFGRAKGAAQQAIAIDPGLAAAYAELAYAVGHHDWDWARAEDLFLRAIRLDDRQDAIHGDFAWLLSWQGRFDEALAHARQAERLAPGSPQAILRTGMILHLARQHEAAARKAAEAIAIDSTFMFGWDRLHWAYHGLNQRAEAVHAAERASELGGPADVRRRGFLANAYARAGRTAVARAILDELLALERRVYVPSNAIAAALVGLGDLDGALTRLERSYDNRDSDMVLLGTFPLWAPLHGLPRFEALVRSMQFTR